MKILSLLLSLILSANAHADGKIYNADVNSNAAIVTSKLAATTASKAVVSNSLGFLTANPNTSNADVSYLGGASSLTAGSVLFSGASSFAQDNARFFWDNTNHRLGLETTSPGYLLTVKNSGDSLAEGLAIEGQGSGASRIWLHYVDPNGAYSIYNPLQGVLGIKMNGVGQVALSNGPIGAPSSAVVIKDQAGRTGDVTLAINKLTSQTADAIEYLDTDNSTVISKVDVAGKGWFVGLDAQSNKINHVTDPTSAQDAATKNYVDTAINDIPAKDACDYSTTAALPSVVYSNGSSGVGATLTGVALAAISVDGANPTVGQRILVKNQVSTFQNGLYIVTATGSGIAVFVLTRTTDYNQSAEMLAGVTTFIVNGTVNATTTWAQNSASSPTVGTDAITFAQVAGPGSLTAGAGISISGSTVSLTSPVTALLGGTGKNSLTTNSIPIGNGTSAVNLIAASTAGSILSANGTGSAPIYTTATYPHTVTSGSVLISTATNVWKELLAGTDNQVLKMSGAAPTWGTNTASVTGLTQNGVVIGQGASAISATSAGSAGAMFSGNGSGSAPIFTTATYPHLVTSGSVLISTAANVWSQLTNGTDGQVMITSGSKPVWANQGFASYFRANSGNGFGSVGNKIRRYSVIVENVGNDFTYLDSSTNGATFTIVNNGVYCMSATDRVSGSGTAMELGFTVNSADLTLVLSSVASANRLGILSQGQAQGSYMTFSYCERFKTGDVVRPQFDGAEDSTTGLSQINFVRVN